MNVKEGKPLQLLGPAFGKCQICAEDEHPGETHNRDSLYYHFWFQQKHRPMSARGHASADCAPDYRQSLKRVLQQHNVPAEQIGDL